MFVENNSVNLTRGNNYGLLWEDTNASRELADKLAPAIRAFKRRIGRTPTMVQINPHSHLDIDDGSVVMGLTVRRSKYVLSNHYFLVEECLEQKPA